MQSHFLLCAVPAFMWDADASLNETETILQGLIQDALAIERRIPKQVNLENERSRYVLCCAQIDRLTAQSAVSISTSDEFYEALRSGRFPAITIDESYLQLMVQADLLEQDQQIVERYHFGRSLFPPDQVIPHIEEFEKLANHLGGQRLDSIQRRIAFFRQLAGSYGCGVIELQEMVIGSSDTEQTIAVRTKPSAEQTALLTSTAVIDEIVQGSRRDAMEQRLRSQIVQAQVTQQVVNASNQPHDITTEVLHKFVYHASGVAEAALRLVYADGSESIPFPICSLTAPDEDRIAKALMLPPLKIALISMRHLDLDRYVDMAWFRNREASQSRTLAEADRFCYDISRQKFEELEALARQQDGLHIHLYHTGFEPAVIAFYRALVETLQHGRTTGLNILVIPHYYRGSTYERGHHWT